MATNSSSPTTFVTAAPGIRPGVPAAAFVALFVASVTVPVVAGLGTMPPPGARVGAVQEWFAGGVAVDLSGTLIMLSAVAWAVFVTVASLRMGALAPGAPGLRVARLAGTLAAATLAFSGAVVVALAGSQGTGSAEVTSTLARLAFVLGGPLHTLTLGVTVLGLSLTGRYAGVISRRTAAVGVGVSVLACASMLSVVANGLVFTVPVGRFSAIVWLLVSATRLPRSATTARKS